MLNRSDSMYTQRKGADVDRHQISPRSTEEKEKAVKKKTKGKPKKKKKSKKNSQHTESCQMTDEVSFSEKSSMQSILKKSIVKEMRHKPSEVSEGVSVVPLSSGSD